MHTVKMLARFLGEIGAVAVVAGLLAYTILSTIHVPVIAALDVAIVLAACVLMVGAFVGTLLAVFQRRDKPQLPRPVAYPDPIKQGPEPDPPVHPTS